MSSIARPARRRRPWAVLIVILVLIIGFIAGIFLSWEAAPPLRRIEAQLPAAALTGGAFTGDASGLQPSQPRFVGPVTVPVRTRNDTDAEASGEVSGVIEFQNPQTQGQDQVFPEGPIVIDGTN